MNEAMRCWATEVADTFYVIGSVAGPHPYPVMVREFQKVIGTEARQQMLNQTGRLPDMLVSKIRKKLKKLKGRPVRIEAARILLMERAYDNNDELRNTAEAILRGEQVDDADLDL